MKHFGGNKKKQIKAIYSVALMVAAMALLAINVPAYATKMDDRIESSAKKSYVFKTYLKNDDIKVQSKDGAVTLTGNVSQESHKSLAQETVAGLPGVKSVDNRLEVKGEHPAENSDAWLTAKVKSTLLFHRSVSAMTEVNTKDGIVTLQGNAASQAQKDLTTEYAKDVEGVKDVKNEMTVSKTSKKTHRTTGEKIDDASITAQVKMTLLYPSLDQCNQHQGHDKAWRGHVEWQGQECSRNRPGHQNRQRRKGCEERKEPDDHRVVEFRYAWIAGPMSVWAMGLSNPEGGPNVVDNRCGTDNSVGTRAGCAVIRWEGSFTSC